MRRSITAKTIDRWWRGFRDPEHVLSRVFFCDMTEVWKQTSVQDEAFAAAMPPPPLGHLPKFCNFWVARAAGWAILLDRLAGGIPASCHLI